LLSQPAYEFLKSQSHRRRAHEVCVEDYHQESELAGSGDSAEILPEEYLKPLGFRLFGGFSDG
jgi:hypothetical protein